MKRIITFWVLLLVGCNLGYSQYFTKVTGVPPANNYAKGYSASWGDYNNDGLDDLITTDNNKHNMLFKNMGNGVFVKDTLNVIYTTNSVNTLGTCWGDYDNDGNLDLLILNSANGGMSNQHNYLFHNDGGGQWTLITNSPVYTDHGWAISGSMVDYDKDGYLDIYIANFGSGTGNFLYHNNGDGTFTKVGSAAGPIVTDTAYSYTAVWADYDNDGWQDCYVVNYFWTLPGQNNALYHNNGNGTFSKDPSLVVNNDGATDQGASWGDYDNDGNLDLFVATYGGLGVNHNSLYHNNGDGTFTFMSALQPSIDNNKSFGSAWLDFNNDGRLDLVVANNPSSSRYNYLYRNDGNGVFTKISGDPVVTDNLRSMGVSISDYDNDGYPDIYIDSWSSTTEPGMYHNMGGTNKWLQVKLTGTVSNKSAIGARLTLWINGQKQIREVQSATGMYCTSSFVQTFGLSTSTVIDSLVIRWPSGIIQHICNPAVNQRLLITEAIDPLPTALTTAATNLDPNGATLNGTINANCSNTTVTFEYGVNTAHWTQVPATPGNVSGNETTNVSCVLTGLLPNTIYYYRVVGTNPTGNSYGGDLSFTTPPEPQFKTLNLKAYLEGLYAGGGMMNQAMDESGAHFGPGIADQVTVELHNAANYSTLEYSSGLVNLGTDGNLSVNTIPMSLSGSYYITIRHRNSIETVSTTAVSFSDNTVSYDFSISGSQAYGDNQKDLGSGHFAIWGGDVNQDGIIDSGDMNPVDNASTAVTFGYVTEDVTGDGIVDSGDMNLVDNNTTAIIMAQLP
jgi:hypothetical protein